MNSVNRQNIDTEKILKSHRTLSHLRHHIQITKTNPAAALNAIGTGKIAATSALASQTVAQCPTKSSRLGTKEASAKRAIWLIMNTLPNKWSPVKNGKESEAAPQTANPMYNQR
jgi:hypothetical protein